MNDGPPAQGGEVPTTTGAKPSIAEVAAWLRRAAEQRDVVEDLRPQARQAPEPAAADEEATKATEATNSTDGEAGATAGAGTPPADATPDHPRADEPMAPAPDPTDESAPVDADGDGAVDEADAGPDRPPDQPDQPDQPDDPAVPPADEPEPGEALGVAGRSDTPVEAVEAPAEHDAGPGPDDAPQPSQPSHAASTTADLESEPAAVDLDLRDPAERRADNGPVEHDEPPVPDLARRPFGIGRSQADAAERAVEPSSARETSDDEPQADASTGERATAPANGAGAQTAAPAQADVEAPADEPEVGLEAPVEAAEPVPAVEALIEDGLPLTPPDADGGDAQPEPPSTDRGNGHDRGAADRPEPAGAAAGGGTASLFDLDLGDLAARARAAGERGEPARRHVPDPSTHRTATSATSATIGTSGTSTTTEVDEPEPEPAVSDVRDRHEVKEIDEVDEAAPAGHALTWDDQDDQGVLIEDAPRDETAHREAAGAPSPPKAKAAAVAKATTVLQRRRTKRKRYPRGQLKERIGVLRRVRAMLGVVVLTVVLGVAAGAAIGAFIVFVAFAVRSAITTG